MPTSVYTKMTPENQTELYLDESRRARESGYKYQRHYSIGDHLVMLSRRLDQIEKMMREQADG